jgi:L-lysine 6-transaminase
MQRSLIDHNVFDSTWSGTLADMVRFVQEWSIVEREDLLEQVHAKSQKLSDGLRSLAWRHRDLITNVRGVGLYQGFTLGAPLTRQNFVAAALARHSLLLMPAGTDSIRLRPSLSVTNADIELLLGFLNELFSNYTDFAH